MRKNLKFFNHDFFETIDTEEKAYWLGFIAADGCIHSKIQCKRRHYEIILTTGEKDYNHLIKFRNSIELNVLPYKQIIYLENKEFIRCTYKLYSKKMYNDLIDKGITERKSLTLEPPKNVPPEHLRHWIRGYFDGDGCISILKERYLQVTILGTDLVLKFISDFCSLNLNPRKPKGRNIFRISFTCKKARLFLFIIYQDSNIYLSRKNLKYLKYI